MRRSGSRRELHRYIGYIKIGAVVLALIIAFFLVRGIRNRIVLGDTDKFYNVTVNGINLKGYTRNEAYELFSQLIADWKATEYTVTADGKQWSFTTDDMGANLDIETQLILAWNMGHYGSTSSRVQAVKAMKNNPYNFTSTLSFDENAVNDFVNGIADEVYIAPTDAEVLVDIDKPRIITESADGRELDRENAVEQIKNMLLTGVQTAELVVNTIEPAVSSDDAAGGLTIIASYYTDMSASSYARYCNVKLALSSFNGFAIYDGDVVSFNEVVGERTPERGYKEAPEYSGTYVVTGYGGGSCQASTTLYAAALLAGMDIIERHPHNMMVSYAEPSCDATVSWGSKDLVIANNTGHTFYLYTKVTRKRAWVVVYGNTPEYFTELKSVITAENLESTYEEIREDVTGQIAYYTDEKVLYSEGKKGCRSQSWLIYYDRSTGKEVSRKQVSNDSYNPGTSIYYVGIHERISDLQ